MSSWSHRFMMSRSSRAVLLACAVLFWGCDGDPPTQTNDIVLEDQDTSSNTDVTNDAPLSDCCEKITCLSNDKVCDPRTCQCEVATDVGAPETTDAQDQNDTTSSPEDCVPFTTPSSCTSGRYCRPRTRDDNTGAWTGRCEDPSGSGSLGDSDCERTGCGTGLECVDDVCEQMCDPTINSGTEPGACSDSSRTCVELLLPNGNRSVFGACLESCTPYVLTDGCPDDTWCFPAFFTPNAGFCEAPGGEPLNATCTPNRPCDENLVCIDNRCARVCDPQATAGNPGFCSDPTTRCLPVGLAGQELRFGHCGFVCDPIQHNCPDNGAFCFFAELGESGFPECSTPPAELAVGASCSGAGLSDLDACGPNRFCIDDVCTQLCVVSDASEFDQSNAACAVGEVCRQLGTAPVVGRCLP